MDVRPGASEPSSKESSPGHSFGVGRLGNFLSGADRLTIFGAARCLIPVLTLIALAATPSVHVNANTLVVVLSAQVVEAAATQLMALRRPSASWMWIGLLFDAAAITALCGLTGGASSPVAFLFTLEALGAGILLSSRLGMRAIALGTAALAGLDAASSQGLIRGGHIRGIQAIATLWLIGAGGVLLSHLNERELRRHVAELATMHGITLDIERSLSLEEILADLCRGVVDRFDFSAAAVLLRNEDHLTCAARHGITSAAHESIPVRGLIERAIQQREPVVVPSAQAKADGSLTALVGGAGYVVVPLGGEAVLVVTRSGRGRRRSVVHAREIQALIGLANHATLALANARLHSRVRAMAITDPLTSLANHGEFQRVLANELGRLERFASLRAPGHHTSLILLDIDFFKRLNDTLGHQAGDEVLCEVAAAIRWAVRAFDVPARYGGEEFTVILPETDPASALIVAERIRSAVKSKTAELAGGKTVTVSLGVASAPEDGRSPAEVIAAADKALYHSKETGRNRVTAAAELRRRGGTLLNFPNGAVKGPAIPPMTEPDARLAAAAGPHVPEPLSRPKPRTPPA